MDFELDLSKIKYPDSFKCPKNIGDRLMQYSTYKYWDMFGWRIQEAPTNNCIIILSSCENHQFIITKELMEPTSLDFQLFEDVVTNTQHGPETSEMCLEFLSKTLT